MGINNLIVSLQLGGFGDKAEGEGLVGAKVPMLYIPHVQNEAIALFLNTICFLFSLSLESCGLSNIETTGDCYYSDSMSLNVLLGHAAYLHHPLAA